MFTDARRRFSVCSVFKYPTEWDSVLHGWCTKLSPCPSMTWPGCSILPSVIYSYHLAGTPLTMHNSVGFSCTFSKNLSQKLEPHACGCSPVALASCRALELLCLAAVPPLSSSRPFGPALLCALILQDFGATPRFYAWLRCVLGILQGSERG